MKILLVSVILCMFLIVVNSTSLDNLRNIFNHDLCIEGNLNTLLKTKKNTKTDEKLNVILNLTSTGTIQESEKSVLAKLQELAQYHSIDYYYTLTKEEGPAHEKEFTLLLTFGTESYYGQGKSHKKAKQDAAKKALENTQYEFPKVQEKTVDDIQQLTPTVLLNNLGSKLGIEVTYYLMDKGKEEILHSNLVVTKENKDYLKKLNASIYNEKSLKMKREIDNTKGPFNLKLKFGQHFFYTTSQSIQSGRHEVASKAIDYLAKHRDVMDIACLKEGSEQECKLNKNKLKSPISKIHEEAQKRKLDLEFELVKESGPAHKKTFETECRLGKETTIGQGSSKKESKRNAAEKMLEVIEDWDPIPAEVEVKNMVANKSKKNKKKKVIKTKMDEINRILDNVQKSVLGFTQNVFSDQNEELNPEHDLEDGIDNSEIKTKPQDTHNNDKGSSQNELLELSNVLNFKVGFTDFSEDNKHASVLSLYTNPEYSCYGVGKTEFDARDIASKNALNLFIKMGIYNLFMENKDIPLERETKDEIQAIISQRISKHKEEL